MKAIRYYLSAMFIDWGVRLIPDDYPKMRMQLGIGTVVDLMLKELNENDSEE